MGTDMKTEESNKKSLGVSIEAGSDPGMSAERGNSLHFENTSFMICSIPSWYNLWFWFFDFITINLDW